MIKKIKRQLAIALLFVLCCTPLTAYAMEFSDVKAEDWFYSDVQSMVEREVVDGYLDGSFRPQGSITIGEFLKMLCTNNGSGILVAVGDEHWSTPYYHYAIDMGWLTYAIDDLNVPATRLFVGELTLAALGIPAITDLPTPYTDIANDVTSTLYDLGIMMGTETDEGIVYRPFDHISRAEICAVLNRCNKLYVIPQPEPSPNPEPEPEPEPVPETTEFIYPMPLVSAPGDGVVSGEYFENALLYMIVNDIYVLDLYFYGENAIQVDQVDIFNDYIFAAHSTVFDEYHELIAFFMYLDVYTTPSHYDNSLTITLDLTSNYYSDEVVTERKRNMISSVENLVAELYALGLVNDEMSDYEKAFVFYEQIALRFEYDMNFEGASFDGFGMFENGYGVCQAYVSLFNMMCEIVGIEAVGVSGISYGDEHIWSYVNLDGMWTYVDPTFADPVPDTAGYFDPFWFDLTREQMMPTHQFNLPYYPSY